MDETPPGVLLLIAAVMVLAITWQNVRYRDVPDATGRSYPGCAVEVAGFAWFCDE